MVKALLEDDKGAIEDHNNVIELNPSGSKAFYNRGTSLVKLGEYKNAKLDFDKALELDPTYYKALINRGICFVRLNKTQDAKSDFTLAVTLSPMDGEGYYYRASATLKDVNVIKGENKKKQNIVLIQENIYAKKQLVQILKKRSSLSTLRLL